MDKVIVLTHGPNMDQMEAIKTLLAAGGDTTTHLRFFVTLDGEMVRHPHGGVKRTPKLVVRVTKIPGNPRLNKQHMPLTVEVLEDFAGGPLMFNGCDIGKAGTVLDLQYSFVDNSAEIEGASVKSEPEPAAET